MSESHLLKRPVKIGSFRGLEFHIRPSLIPVALIIWAISSLLGLKLFKWKPVIAASTGFLTVVIHFASETWHQLGHAKMAQQTGYPMQGIEFWGPLATSVYPENEGMLSADVHIQRALGGPIFSLTLALITGAISLALRPFGGAALVLVLFSFLDNFFVFTIGALIPLGFNDGSTLIHWWRNRTPGQRFLRLN